MFMKDFCFKHVVLFIVLFMIMCLVFHDHLFHLFNEITLHFYLHYNAIVAAATIMLFVLLFVFIMYCNQEKYEALIKNDVEIYRKDVVAFMSDTPSDSDLLKRDRYAKYLLDKIFQTYYVQNEKGKNRNHSFVIHIGENYGHGKSSFLLMLKKYASHNPTKVIYIEFLPWLCDNEESIIREFFNTFIANVSFRLPSIQHSVRRYMSLLLDAISVKGFHGLYFDLIFFKHHDTIKDVHDEIRNELLNIDRPIVVTIDDVDRLQSSELMMVLKLIRDVADFPNVYYIIAADNNYLESMLKSRNVMNPSEYLKKFFNFEFQMPANEKIALDVLLDHINSLLKKMLDDSNAIQDCLDRIKKLDIAQYIFANMREVYRFLNVLNMQFDLIKSNKSINFDYYDLFCLTVLKFRCPEFYILLRDNFERILETNLIHGCDSLLSLKSEYLTDYSNKDEQSVNVYSKLVANAKIADEEIVMVILNELFGKSKRVGANNICRMNMFYKYFANDIAKNVIDRMELLECLNLSDVEFEKKIHYFFMVGKGLSVQNEFPFVFQASSGISFDKLLLKYLTYINISYKYSMDNIIDRNTIHSREGYVSSDKVKPKLEPILKLFYDSKNIGFDKKKSGTYLENLKHTCESCGVDMICPLLVCLDIMRENIADYLFLPQNLKDVYYILLQRFINEVMAQNHEKITDGVIDTLLEITGSPFASDLDEKPIRWQYAFVDYLCQNAQVFVDCLKKQVIIYGNGDIEWNNRFNTVYFSAIYFNNHQNLQNLYNAYSNLGNVISDLNSWHDSASKSLQGFTLNSAYFEFVKQ